jgi:hypothetical protein
VGVVRAAAEAADLPGEDGGHVATVHALLDRNGEVAVAGRAVIFPQPDHEVSDGNV